MLLVLNFYFGRVITLENCLALTLSFDFLVCCFPLLEFMIKLLNIRSNCLQEFFVAEVSLSYPVPHKILPCVFFHHKELFICRTVFELSPWAFLFT